MSAAVALFLIVFGMFLESSVSKQYTCYETLAVGTSKRNYSCQTQSRNVPNETTTPLYPQTTPRSYPGCPQSLSCIETPPTSQSPTTDGLTSTTAPKTMETTSATTTSTTTTMTSAFHSTTTNLKATTERPTIEATTTRSILSSDVLTTRESQTSLSTTPSLTTSLSTTTLQTTPSSTTILQTSPYSTTTLQTTSYSTTMLQTTPYSTTTLQTTPYSTTILQTTPDSTTTLQTTPDSTTTLQTTRSSTTTIPTTPYSTTTLQTTPSSTTTIPTTSSSTTTALLTTSSITASFSATSVMPSALPLLAANDPEATTSDCPTFDTLTATLNSEDIWCQEIFQDHCQSGPCQNGATCIDEPYRYRCLCATGFTDSECMTQINLCESYPCDPFGQCEDFLNGYNCTCKTGFRIVNSTYCEDIDECQLPGIYEKCSNGSLCKNYPGGYECLCQKGKLGKYCELDDKKETQTVTSIQPTFGLMAGGGLLVMNGTNLNLYPALGAFFKPENEKLDELYGFAEGNISDGIVIRVPRAPNASYVGQKMSIKIKYSNEKNVSIQHKYLYTDNPNITSIIPQAILVAAGIRLTIMGQNMNSVSSPFLSVKAVMMDNVTSEFKKTECMGINNEIMLCQLPQIPDPNTNPTKSSSMTRKKRNAILEDDEPSLTIQRSSLGKQGMKELMESWLEIESIDLRVPWKASIRYKRDLPTENSNLSRTPAKLYLGLEFDNFPRYTNLTRSYPRYKPQLILDGPIFKIRDSTQEYDPRTGESLKIEGERMNAGLSLEDYKVLIGLGYCQPSHLEESLLECLPPKFRPDPGPNADLFHCEGNLPVMVQKGSLALNFYACMKYVQSDQRAPLIIGLSVGLTGFLILIVIIVWLAFCFRRRKGKLHTEDGDESTAWKNELRPSYRRMMADPEADSDERNVAGGYSTDFADNLRRGQEQNPSDIVSVSQRARGQGRDYFFYGESNPDAGQLKKQTYGDFLKPKDRFSYTRPNRQFDEVEPNPSEPKTYKQVYHNMSFNKLDD